MLERLSRLHYVLAKLVMHQRCQLLKNLEAVNRALHLGDVSGMPIA
ncbi:hypothetical protein KQH60_01050 [Mycetohabitans sp. B8]|nr:hypothetical protein [Mycetohabitans sp. B8]MCG1041224.1 hypothetical protein [Mycetohabitans sp. B8]